MAQVAAQVPLAQVWPDGQGLDAEQAVQSAGETGVAHVPLVQMPEGHTTPHEPQLFESAALFTQFPLHNICPVGQPTGVVQMPAWQVWFDGQGLEAEQLKHVRVPEQTPMPAAF